MDAVTAWEKRGRFLQVTGRMIFVVDAPAAEERSEPLLLLHGFPTCSFDWRHVIDSLAATRRVVALDFLGFGLSDKPADIAYSLFDQADIVEAVTRALGIDRAAVLSHDMGDSVAGELLARSIEGRLPFEVTRRVLTNGSIFMELVQLSAGQQMLLALPDEALPVEAAPAFQMFGPSLAATFAAGHQPSEEELAAQWELLARQNGQTLLPKLIRYVNERYEHEGRWTGALRDHPAPVTVVWGDEDPIAVYGMAKRFVAERPGTPLVRLDGVGHYLQIEAPDRWLDAVSPALD